jgi:hypothetical protein
MNLSSSPFPSPSASPSLSSPSSFEEGTISQSPLPGVLAAAAVPPAEEEESAAMGCSLLCRSRGGRCKRPRKEAAYMG